jgi:hypothetical protein
MISKLQMISISISSRVSLASQEKAYDFLQSLSEGLENGIKPSSDVCEQYCAAYEAYGNKLDAAYDEAALRDELATILRPLQDAVTEARIEAASAAALHEFAKEVFEIWQTGGFFARRRALRELRERAGFRLESHRIGNYVAKTFDLANEAQARFARAQQQLFKADVSYKLRPGVYGEIYNLLSA